MKGIFISFEGPDGAGKTTQMKMLGERLEGMGRAVLYTREPGGTLISEKIRNLLLDPSHAEMVDRTEALLYAASRAQHVEELIRPALAAGKVVLCDRFTDSTIAYQGFGRGIDIDFLDQLNRMATAGVMPNITIILDIDPEQGMGRISEKRIPSSGGGKDRIEQENMGFHERVRDGFLRLAELEPDRCRVVNAGRNRDTVHEEVFTQVKGVLQNENT